MNASSSKTEVEHWLRSAADRLEKAGIGSARLDCLILLEDLTGRARAWLLANPEHRLTAAQIKKLEHHIDRRAEHEPLAYIRGFTEFYGRSFKVDCRVLEPRPESETMIELLKEVVPSRVQTPVWIADIGTGSGCLGITAALELSNARVDLYDIDRSALTVARHNVLKHRLHLDIYKRDLLSGVVRPYDAILANLPYIPSHWNIHRSIRMEPQVALRGGKDGLEVYQRLFSQLQGFPWQSSYIFTESLPPQHRKLAGIALSAGYRLMKTEDFIQVFKLK